MTVPPKGYRDARVTVMGLGGFGGGQGVARFLAERGARVTVTDLRDEADLAEAVQRLADLPIAFHLGRHDERDFVDADAVVVNPAVKPDSPYLALARRSGLRLDTAVNIFLRHCPATVVGVTGSNGKSTTAGLIESMVRSAGRPAWLGGNVGGSLLPDLERIRADHVVVLELSSFQLHRLPWDGRAPHVGVVLNVTPNHLDWHPTFEHYAAAKRNLLALQTHGDLAVLNADDSIIAGWGDAGGGEKVWIARHASAPDRLAYDTERVVLRQGETRQEVSLAGLVLQGAHNRLNAACAAAAAWLVGTPPDAIERALAEFGPLPHRLERIAIVDGVAYVDDSVSTTPESTIAALQAFDVPVHLIAGGSEKGTPFAEMGRAVSQHARSVALIGQTAGRIEDAIRAAGPSGVAVTRCADLARAVDSLRQAARAGHVILLSPGCASFDMFRSYVDRAEQFRKLVPR